jgi:hypothetical protein
MLLFGVAACGSDEQLGSLDPPATPVLSVRARWAVISDPYVRLFEASEVSSPVRFHLREDTVVEILSKTNYQVELHGRRDFWYQVRAGDRSGWVFGSEVELYESEERARNAAETEERAP